MKTFYIHMVYTWYIHGYTMYIHQSGYIWNRDMHYRNRVFSMYQFGSSTYLYVLSTDWYRKSILVQTSTYQYVLSMYQNNVKYVGHQ